MAVTYENAKARVFVLYTGGTIGMVPSEPGNPASPLRPGTREELLQYAPGLGERHGVYWEVHGLPDVGPLDSSDVNSSHWLKMATAIEQAYPKWDGFVILHGTDTMAYTTSGLSFLLANLAKPVVVTGSQLPLFDERTDARVNLANAIHVAAHKATGLPLIPEVVLCFGDSLLRGNRARKKSTSDINGFESPNYPPLGSLGEHIDINAGLLRQPPDNSQYPFYAVKSLCTNVMDFVLFPGLRPAPLGALLMNDDIKGVIMRTFGAGNAMSDPEILDQLRNAIAAEKVILNVTQCPKGMVEMGLYEASSALLDMGVISGLDMTPEAALAKMFWILETEVGGEVQSQLQINQRGEQSEDLFDVRYGAQGSEQKPLEVAKTSASAPGLFRKEHLKRAVLRISGLSFQGLSQDNPFEIRVFVNLPTASRDTPADDAHCAARFQGTYSGPTKTLIADVTPAIRQFAESGRAIGLTLVSPTGQKFWCRGAFLALFAVPA